MTDREIPAAKPASSDPATPARTAGPGWWPLALFTVVFVVAQGPLLNGSLAPRWDASAFYDPYYVLVADHAQAGELLLWNPWAQGGSPDVAEPQVGAFSPLTVTLGLLTGGSTQGFRFYWFFIWWLGGVGVLLLARRLRAPPWSGAAAALAFVLCGFYTGHAQHTSFVYAFSALPWALWRLEAALDEGRWWPAAEAGALWGLGSLAGYPAIAFLNACFAGFWMVGRVLFPPDSRQDVPTGRRWLHGVGALALMGLVGLVVILPTYVAFFGEGSGFTGRSQPLPREVAVSSNPFPPRAATTAASPVVADLTVHHRLLFDGADPSALNIYLAPLVALLALAGVLTRSPWRWWLLGIALLFLATATGPVTPLRGWLYDLVPPTRYFRHPGMFRGYFLFGLVVLFLEAARDLAVGPPGTRRRLITRMGALAVPLSLVGAYALWRLPGWLGATPPALALGQKLFLLTVAGLVLVFLLGRRRATSAGIVAAVILLLVVFDTFQAAALTRNLTGAGGGQIGFFESLDAGHDADLSLLEDGDRNRLLDSSPGSPEDDNHNLYLKEPVFDGYGPMINSFHERWIRDPALLPWVLGERRVWFAADAWQTPTGQNVMTALSGRAPTLPLVVHDPDELLAPGEEVELTRAVTALHPLPALEPPPVEWRLYEPNELEFDVEVPAGGGWLWVTERFAPGWRAWVDDAPTEILPGNLIFRSLRVTGGRHRVRMTYRPKGYPYLVWVSWGTLLGVALGSGLVAGREWQRRRREEDLAPVPRDRPDVY